MPSGPNSGSPNSESGMADGRWRVVGEQWPVASECEERDLTPHVPRLTPHASLKLGANQVSRVPETGRPLPLLVISGLATHGDRLRFLFNALPTLPLLARTVSGCVNSAFPIHFYTIYGPSVQTMDTQLNALPTLLSSLGAFCLFELRVF
jgi:hypothetical protein